MEGLAKVLGDLVLVALLPGFLVAKARDLFTERSSSRALSADVVRAMIYWLPILAVLWVVSVTLMPELEPFPLSGDLQGSTLIAALLTAVVIGSVFGVIGERRAAQNLAIKLRLSKKTWKTPWLDAFRDAEDGDCWAVVWLGDGTRFMGWPKYVSDVGKSATVYLSRIEGREADTAVRIMPPGANEWDEIPGIGVLLPPPSEIRHIDFLTGSQPSSVSDTKASR